MLESLRQKQLSAKMILHYFIMVLVFPLYTSAMEIAYSPDLVYPNFFVIAFLVLAVLEGNVDWRRKKWLGYGMIVCLACFNLYAYKVNRVESGWYYGQINMTIAFLFLIGLLFMKDSAACMQEEMVRSLLKTALVIVLISVIPAFLGVRRFSVSVDGYSVRTLLGKERSYNWLYYHKSEYSFILVMLLAFSVRFRALYEKKWQFWLSAGLCCLGMACANTRVTMLAALFIPAGLLLDYLVKKAGGFRLKNLLWLLPFAAAGLAMLAYFSREREVGTLGGRIYIWQGAIDQLREYPNGAGFMAGLQMFPVNWGTGSVNNCHNVFLNFMLQFSNDAGFFCILMMLGVFLAGMLRKRSFLTVGILVALLIPLNMDWCLLIGQMPLALLLMYYILLYPEQTT